MRYWKSSIAGLEKLPMPPFCITSGTVFAVISQEESLMWVFVVCCFQGHIAFAALGKKSVHYPFACSQSYFRKGVYSLEDKWIVPHA